MSCDTPGCTCADERPPTRPRVIISVNGKAATVSDRPAAEALAGDGGAATTPRKPEAWQPPPVDNGLDEAAGT